MIASKLFGALMVASVCSLALGAGIHRAETKGGSSESSGYASPAQIGSRKSAESNLKAEASKTEPRPSERLEQIRQKENRQEEYKQEEYREEIVQAPTKSAAPAAPIKSAAPAAPLALAKGERKVPAAAPAPTKSVVKLEEAPFKTALRQEQHREEQKEYKQEQLREEQREYRQEQLREEPKEYKQEQRREDHQEEYKQQQEEQREQKIEQFEQKRLQPQLQQQQLAELDAEPAYVRYEEQQLPLQQQQQFELKEEQQQQVKETTRYEAKGGAKKTQSLAALEQIRQQTEEAAQQPAGEPEPYQFSYQIDGSSRSEQQDTKGVVKGQYTLKGADGASRVVDYIADHNGFRASVQTNEFGTESKSPASIQLRTSQPTAEEISIRLEQTKTVQRRTESAKGGTRHEEAAYSAKGYAQAAQEQAREAAYPAKGYAQAAQESAHEAAKGQLAELRAPEAAQESQRASAEELLEHPQQPRFGGKYPQGRSSLFESATAHQERRTPAAPVASRSRLVRPEVTA